MMNRIFDRLVKFDPRSRAFPVRKLIGYGIRPRSYTWRCGKVLDQGSEGACTGFAVAHEIIARPVEVLGVNESTAHAIYTRARQIDEWPGENYEGSSVLAAIKAGAEKGYYGEYRWAFGEKDLALAVSYKGPAVLGINWYEGMETPDENGILHVSGAVLGGHAILCNGYSATRKLYRLHNSWGPGWGKTGEAFITAEDMARLLSEDGEACIPMVRLKIV